MKFNNRVYDGLKFVALVLLPGFSAAYFSLSEIWHLPNATQVVGTATVVDTFLGLLLKASSRNYEDAAKVDEPADGELVIVSDEDGQYMGVAWDEKFKGLMGKDTIKLNVVQKEPKVK